jgi:hypothetical protein
MNQIKATPVSAVKLAEKAIETMADANSKSEVDDDGLIRIKEHAQAVYDRHQKDPKQDSFNLLLLGEMGGGKTFILRTARFPVHLDSFDPGGSKGLRKWIKEGKIIVDSRWESESRLAPWAFDEWLEVMEHRQRIGYFKHIGTYALDSSTMWAEAAMNKILLAASRPGTSPRFTKDYEPQKNLMRNSIKEILDLPCDFIMTGHLEQFNDVAEGTVRYRYMTTGKGAIIIPTQFDEIWVCAPTEGSGGVKYRVLTQSTGTHTCRSRLAELGLLEQYEEPDIKAILKKVGHEYEDKPLLIG